MSYQATAVTNAMAFRLKGYTNAVMDSVAKKIYHWGKKNVPRDLALNGTPRKTTRTRGKTRRLRTEDPRKIWGEPWHIADRGAAFRGDFQEGIKQIIGPNFKGKRLPIKVGSIGIVYSNIKIQKRRDGTTRKFDYAQAPNPAKGRPQNIQTFLDERLTASEIKNMINESMRECSKKL